MAHKIKKLYGFAYIKPELIGTCYFSGPEKLTVLQKILRYKFMIIIAMLQILIWILAPETMIISLIFFVFSFSLTYILLKITNS